MDGLALGLPVELAVLGVVDDLPGGLADYLQVVLAVELGLNRGRRAEEWEDVPFLVLMVLRKSKSKRGGRSNYNK